MPRAPKPAPEHRPDPRDHCARLDEPTASRVAAVRTTGQRADADDTFRRTLPTRTRVAPSSACSNVPRVGCGRGGAARRTDRRDRAGRPGASYAGAPAHPGRAPRHQGTTGGFDLGFLGRCRSRTRWNWLRACTASGRRRSACVLMFALGRPPCPSTRTSSASPCALGSSRSGQPRAPRWQTGEGRRTAGATVAMTPRKRTACLRLPYCRRKFYAFHIGLIKHGRRACAAQRPRCPAACCTTCAPARRSSIQNSAPARRVGAADERLVAFAGACQRLRRECPRWRSSRVCARSH